MRNLIKKALNGNKNAIIELNNFPNIDGEGSYNLGCVLTQIIYRIGEKDFESILREIPKMNELELKD